jgi:DNA-binding CsgD family transcriptional regulator/catechol 2,3-dioxygenase-like lactoylglutathione lyase family enzyme
MTKRGRPTHDDVLTPAEWKVVEFVRHGLSNPAIAKRQGVSMDAVKYHVANALLKLGLESRKALRQWDGVNKSSLLFSDDKVVHPKAAPLRVGQIARSVKNIAAAKDWYENCLGLTHLYTFGKLCFFDCDGVRLFLQETEAESADSIIYFRVENIRTAYSALAKRGVKFINAPHMIHKHEDGTEEWFCFFNDNEGRPLAIMTQVKAQLLPPHIDP